MRQDDFVNFMRATICKFEQSNSYGTAHIYKNSLSNLIAFYRTDRIPFKKITPELLKGFEFYLRQKQLSWNTVSTYLRTIRATYNRAVDRHLADRKSTRLNSSHITLYPAIIQTSIYRYTCRSEKGTERQGNGANISELEKPGYIGDTLSHARSVYPHVPTSWFTFRRPGKLA